MKVIHKIAAVVIKDNGFLLVRKKGKDIWTFLGGKPEGSETEVEALLREIMEEVGCSATIIKKIGDFEAPAIFDPATVRLSTYIVDLHGNPVLCDDELEELKYIQKDYKEKGIKLPDSIELQIIPYCIENKLLNW